MNSNRCPECGGVANHLVTDLAGHSFYRCMNGLTTFRREGGELTRVSRIVPCDIILDDKRKKYTGTIGYVSSNDIRILAVTDGKERR